MNKKGFTLIELLSVITLLGVVLLIGSISVSNVKNKMNLNMFENKLNFVLKAARSYGQDNQFDIASGSETKIEGQQVKYKLVTISDLIKSDDLETEEKDENNKSSINHYIDNSSINDLKIALYVLNNRVYACIPVDNSVISGTSSNASILFKGDLNQDKFTNDALFCRKEKKDES